MASRLVIYVDFDDDSDFDFFRSRFVGKLEDYSSDLQDETSDDGYKSDGKIDVTWDTEDIE